LAQLCSVVQWDSSSDGRSPTRHGGLYAVNAKALPLLAEPFRTEAPEIEALLRLDDADLRVEEVPVADESASKWRLEAARPKGPEGDNHGDRNAPGRPFRVGAPVALIARSLTEAIQILTQAG
jgi:hypothetical protein